MRTFLLSTTMNSTSSLVSCTVVPGFLSRTASSFSMITSHFSSVMFGSELPRLRQGPARHTSGSCAGQQHAAALQGLFNSRTGGGKGFHHPPRTLHALAASSIYLKRSPGDAMGMQNQTTYAPCGMCTQMCMPICLCTCMLYIDVYVCMHQVRRRGGWLFW